jgi:KaiC/GvpD/RAD55 family RecA-like ATPase
MAQDRVKTYIKGFDEYLEGGIPKGHVVLFSGTPGTMKSSVTWNILWHNARTDGRKCLYLSLEQSEKSILDQMGRLGMSPDAIGDKGKLTVIDLGTIRAEMARAQIESDKENWSNVVQGLVGDQQQNGLEVLAIDSLDAYELLFERQLTRNEMFQFFEWLRRLDITVLLIAEMSPDSGRFSKYDESFLADGIIHLKLAEISDVDVQRRIRCVKMRGTRHAPGYHSLLVEGGQFAVTKAILE